MLRAPIFLNWIQRLANSVRRVVTLTARSPRVSRRRPGPTNRVEALEARELLTTFTVDTLIDVVDAGDGVTSLREAIEAANGQSGADTIQFASSANGTLTLTLGELNITDTLTIEGNGANQTVLDANGRSRVLHFEAATGDLTLQG